jgi:hypothetical protein
MQPDFNTAAVIAARVSALKFDRDERETMRRNLVRKR